jgi:hypothetical protein
VAFGTARPASAAPGTDDTSGFFYGTDSYGPTALGSAYPYTEPGTGGLYGSYVGEIGTWTNWRGCTAGYANNTSDIAMANADEAFGPIPGVDFYWFAAGPGADPRYNRTYAEAYRWGVAQAERVAADYRSFQARGIVTSTTFTPLMFMDVETQPLPGYGNGWNEIVNNCGQIVAPAVIPVSVDRATFNGFTDYIRLDTLFHPGVYSTPSFWSETFGTGAASRIPNTYEWTPVTSTGDVLPRPAAFSQSGQSATWFGGVDNDRKAGWQWNQNGGDYDQWNSANLP